MQTNRRLVRTFIGGLEAERANGPEASGPPQARQSGIGRRETVAAATVWKEPRRLPSLPGLVERTGGLRFSRRTA